jgi:hypothetical protein
MALPSYSSHVIRLDTIGEGVEIPTAASCVDFRRVDAPLIVRFGSKNADPVSILCPQVLKFRHPLKKVLIDSFSTFGFVEVVFSDEVELLHSSPKDTISEPAAAMIGQADINIPAVALQHSVMRMEAPPGIICEIRKLAIHSDKAGLTFCVWHRGNTPVLPELGTIPPSTFTDGRFLSGGLWGPRTPRAIFSTGSQVAVLPDPTYRQFIPADGVVFEPLNGWRIGTGNGLSAFLDLEVQGVQATLEGGIEWREYEVT